MGCGKCFRSLSPSCSSPFRLPAGACLSLDLAWPASTCAGCSPALLCFDSTRLASQGLGRPGSRLEAHSEAFYALPTRLQLPRGGCCSSHLLAALAGLKAQGRPRDCQVASSSLYKCPATPPLTRRAPLQVPARLKQDSDARSHDKARALGCARLQLQQASNS